MGQSWLRTVPSAPRLHGQMWGLYSQVNVVRQAFVRTSHGPGLALSPAGAARKGIRFGTGRRGQARSPSILDPSHRRHSHLN